MTQSKKAVLALAKKIAIEINVAVNGDVDPILHSILETCCDRPKLFSGKNVLEKDDGQLTNYLKKNIRGYHRDVEKFSLPKNKDANIDRAMFVVLRALSPKLEQASDAGLTRVLEDHKTCMVAENVLGDLLERYVAPVLQRSGWLWCAGRLVKTVDFLKPGEPLRLLQVKNSFNSENSSGSGYRVEGGVPSWYRRNGNGTFNWEKLEDNDGSLTEDGFHAFVTEQVAKVSSSGTTGEQ